MFLILDAPQHVTWLLARAGRVHVLAWLVFAACASRPVDDPVLQIAWRPVDSLNVNLPAAVRVYAGRSERMPLRAWYVRIVESDPAVETRVMVSDDETDRRESATSFARDSGACVVVNGGYFSMNQTPAHHAGLLKVDNEIWQPATRTVTRNSQSYEATRAAIGFTGDDSISIGWITTRNDTLYSWPQPPAHRPGRPAPPLAYEHARVWEMRDALGAGPVLVWDGRVRVAADEEVFFGSSIPEVHPRTAAGRTEDGSLLLLVVDGRQTQSRGVDLDELARMMRGLGAVQALNLDGGGSSTLVVNGVVVNRPVGGTAEREVMSALVTFCDR